MNKVFTILLLLTIGKIFAQPNHTQRNTNAVPLNEIDSMFVGPLPGHMALQYNVTHAYSVDCLDTFDLFSNSTGNISRNYNTWKRDYNGQPYRSTVLAQRYTSGTWTNYNQTIEDQFASTCADSLRFGQGWSGSSWYNNTGSKTTGTFNAQGQPVTTLEKIYDSGSGLWYDLYDRKYSFSAAGQLTSIDYTVWAYYSTTTSFKYIDSNYSFISYNNYCDNKIDSYVTWKLTAGVWAPSMKVKYNYYPNGGSQYRTYAWNGTAYDSSANYLWLKDRFGNDSIYMLRNYNTGTHQWGTQSHDIYLNTYDANNNLIRVENLSNYQTTNKDSVQPYTIKVYSNYVACSSGPSAIAEAVNGIGYSIYPNPGHGKITVTLADMPEDETILTITNMMGQKIKEQKLLYAKEEIELDQPDGIYIAIITSAKTQGTSKIIVRH